MNTSTAAKKKRGGALSGVGRAYWDGLKALSRCPREIWISYVVKVLESLCYFSSVLVLMSFLTKNMGLTDIEAGTVFGIFSASMSFFMLFVGFIADSMGIKKALVTGLVIALVGRVLITFTTEPAIVYPGLAILSIGFAYMIPLLAASVKLFSTPKAQPYAFSWYYVVMNVGSLIAGLSLGSLKTAFTEPVSFGLLGLEMVIEPIQMIFLVAVVATLISLLLTVFFVRKEIPAEELMDAPEPAEEGADAAEIAAPVPPKPKEKRSVLQVMKAVSGDRLFWVFIVFVLLLVLVKMIFQYNHSLYPLYMERIGLDEWTGTLYAINPAMIIILVPIATALTRNMKAYNVIMLGCFVSAGSVLFMGLGESIALIVMFQVMLSIGEAFWSPRLYDYTASIAPPGQEASYMALSKVPMFFAKVGAGPATGILLFTLCPAEGERNTELMWIIVGATTLISPIALFMGRRFLDVESRKKALAAKALAAKG